MVSFIVLGDELPWMTKILAQDKRHRETGDIGIGQWSTKERLELQEVAVALAAPAAAPAEAAAAGAKQQEEQQQGDQK